MSGSKKKKKKSGSTAGTAQIWEGSVASCSTKI